MLKTLRNQEPAYAELYNKVVAVGYERIPHNSQRYNIQQGLQHVRHVLHISYEADYMSHLHRWTSLELKKDNFIAS